MKKRRYLIVLNMTVMHTIESIIDRVYIDVKRKKDITIEYLNGIEESIKNSANNSGDAFSSVKVINVVYLGKVK